MSESGISILPWLRRRAATRRPPAGPPALNGLGGSEPMVARPPKLRAGHSRAPALSQARADRGPLGLLDSSLSAAALYTESRARDNSRNFGAGWGEFDVMSIPVLVEGEQTVFDYHGEIFTIVPGSQDCWGRHYTNDANGEALYDLASLKPAGAETL